MQIPFKASKRIEISGGIASGKTTLCKLLEQYGAISKFEDFKINPFWTLFYQDPNLYAFETEVTFLLQHYSQIKTTPWDRDLVAFDYSLLQDVAYADMNLREGARRAFDAVYRHIQSELAPPRLIVHLQCDAHEELRRIQLRARPEEETISVSYLEALNGAISRAVDRARRRTLVLCIDSAAIDFAANLNVQGQVVADIFAVIGG